MARPRGRPPFKPTPAQRHQVAVAAGGGMSHEAIAMAIGIAHMTLLKHFEAELSVGAVKKRMDVLVCMHQAAKKGNVSAQKAYMALVPSVGVPPLPDAVPEVTSPAPQPEPARALVAPQGKKEIAQAAALTAQNGTEWADLLPAPSSPLQ